MHHRKLEIPGFFVDPPPFDISFDGHALRARPGEPLGITLLAHGIYLVGRSSKYHRPRGLYCGRGQCGRCLARIDEQPGMRACSETAHPDATATSEHTLGGAKHDLLATLDWVFPDGLHHHELMTGSKSLNQIAVAVARSIAGHGTLPTLAQKPAGDEVGLSRVDVAIVGAGAAGRAVHESLEAQGIETLLLDAERDAALPALGGARVVGRYDDRELLVLRGGALMRVEAQVTVLATGAMEPPPACTNNDMPGLLSRRLVERALKLGVRPGLKVALVVAPEAGPTTLRAARALAARLGAAGVQIELGLNTGALPNARRTLDGRLSGLVGGHSVERVTIENEDESYECDAVVWCPDPVPDYALARQMGVDAPFDRHRRAFVPAARPDGRTAIDGVLVAGEAAGIDAAEAAAHGQTVAATVRTLLDGRRGDEP